jgi:addiction module HigA family antidote
MTDVPIDRMPPVHPGEIIRFDILEPLGMSVTALAMALRVPQSRMAEIVAGRRGVSADTALRLARYLNSTPDFWLRLQADYDLRVASEQSGTEIARQVLPREAVQPSP